MTVQNLNPTNVLLLVIRLYSNLVWAVLHCLNESGFSVASLIHLKHISEHEFADIHVLLTPLSSPDQHVFLLPRRAKKLYFSHLNSQASAIRVWEQPQVSPVTNIIKHQQG